MQRAQFEQCKRSREGGFNSDKKALMCCRCYLHITTGGAASEQGQNRVGWHTKNQITFSADKFLVHWIGRNCQLYGSVTVFISRVTAVWESKRPLTDAEVWRMMWVEHRAMPSKCELLFTFTKPATCTPERFCVSSLKTPRLQWGCPHAWTLDHESPGLHAEPSAHSGDLEPLAPTGRLFNCSIGVPTSR